MNYQKLSKQTLIERLMALEILNKQLLEEKEQEELLHFSWTGNLGHWYWNIKTNMVVFNPMKITTLGYSSGEIPKQVPYQFFTDKLHEDDYAGVMEAMLSHLRQKAQVYEAEYRIRAKNGEWKWFYDRGKITQYDQDGSPLLISGIVFDVTEKKETQLDLEQKNRLLEELSTIDGLTQLENHRTVIEHLASEVYKSEYSKSPLSIAMLDIDNFKSINDLKGHLTGDEVLRGVSDIIVNSIRDKDIAGRYGGEEFLIIFPNTKEKTAMLVANRIREHVQTHEFGQDLKVTLSGGVKELQGESVPDLIRAADTNLYLAKGSGKNNIK